MPEQDKHLQLLGISYEYGIRRNPTTYSDLLICSRNDRIDYKNIYKEKDFQNYINKEYKIQRKANARQ